MFEGLILYEGLYAVCVFYLAGHIDELLHLDFVALGW